MPTTDGPARSARSAKSGRTWVGCAAASAASKGSETASKGASKAATNLRSIVNDLLLLEYLIGKRRASARAAKLDRLRHGTDRTRRNFADDRDERVVDPPREGGGRSVGPDDRRRIVERRVRFDEHRDRR